MISILDFWHGFRDTDYVLCHSFLYRQQSVVGEHRKHNTNLRLIAVHHYTSITAVSVSCHGYLCRLNETPSSPTGIPRDLLGMMKSGAPPQAIHRIIAQRSMFCVLCNLCPLSHQSRECYLEYEHKELDGDPQTSVGDHPVRRGVLRDVDEMEKLMDNLFNFELAAYSGAHTPVSFSYSLYLLRSLST